MSLYRNAGLAVTFSPRLDALLAEAAHREAFLFSTLSLIHAGPATSKSEDGFRKALKRAGLPEDTPIYFEEGQPDEAILRAVRRLDIDFLIAGAIERERAYRYYMGSVAHNLVRQSPCSLLLFTEPSVEPQPFRNVCLVTDYSEGSLIALVKTLRYAEREGAERVFVLRALSQYGEALVLSEGLRREQATEYQKSNLQEEMALLQDFVDAAGHTEVPVEPYCIPGHPGTVIARFVPDHSVDLLVMSSSARFGHFFERLFPSDMEWLLREIPCNMWVVREASPVL